jgi:hypothetical protein
MSSFIGNVLARRAGSESLEPGKRIDTKNDDMDPQFFVAAADGRSMHSGPISLKILETASFFFQKKGFEKTTTQDICSKLEIKPSLFYSHFDSLDEVLEILWAR